MNAINKLNTRQFCNYARFANEGAKRVSKQTERNHIIRVVLLLLLYAHTNKISSKNYIKIKIITDFIYHF